MSKKTKTKKNRVPPLDFNQVAALVAARSTGQPIPKGITPEQVAEYDRQNAEHTGQRQSPASASAGKT